MADENLLQTQYDRARLLTKISVINFVFFFLITCFVLFSGVVKNWVLIDVYSLTIIPNCIILLYSLAAIIYGSISAGCASEELEKAILLKSKRQSAFDVNEDVRYTAKRRLINYSRYSPYFYAVTGILIIGLTLFVFWKSWSARVALPPIENALEKTFLAAVLAMISVLVGSFLIGQSRLKEFRWLRPVGAWMIMLFVNSGLAALAALFMKYGKTDFEAYTRNILFVLYAILAVELLFSVVMEFYRPRTSGIQKPVFESRLLALFTEPGGVMRNIADTLDYQFGFNVSRTWIYQFLETAIAKMVIIWMIILWLTTSIAEVGPDEVGVRETFGKRGEKALESGLYVTLPWPFGKISRFAVYRVHEIVVGPEMKKKDGKEVRPPVVLWTKSHYAKEARFVVAADKKAGSTSDEVPVGFLSASFPIQYRIKKEKIFEYAYEHKDPAVFLKNLSEKVITNYLASADLLKIMAEDRAATITDLSKAIQKEVDKANLGLEIVCVNFHDSHPPVEKVAPAYEDVIGALEEKEAVILKAKAESVKKAQKALAEEKRLILKAQAGKNAVIALAKAEKDRFQKQYRAYKEMPEMFKLRTYLKILEDDTADIRKYILSENYNTEVYQINLEEKTRYDLLDADLTDFEK